MARLTSEKAVKALGNRYDLILVAARRARELNRGDMPKVVCKNSAAVTAIREIEAGHIDINYLYKSQDLSPKPRQRKY